MKAFISILDHSEINSFYKGKRDYITIKSHNNSKESIKNINIGDIFFLYIKDLQYIIGVYKYVQNQNQYSEDEKGNFILQVEEVILFPLSKSLQLKTLPNLELKTSSGLGSLKLNISSNDSFIFLQKMKDILEGKAKIGEDNKRSNIVRKHKISSQYIIDNIYNPNDSVKLSNLIQHFSKQSKGIKDDHSDHVKIQALLTEIGNKWGMQVWIPMADRDKVMNLIEPTTESILLDNVPIVSTDQNVIDTILNLDVIWVQQGKIIRVFEVEDSTPIFSGLLRILDLVLTQNDSFMKCHIVASETRKGKVFKEMKRPAFERLNNICTYISYQGIQELSKTRYLSEIKHTALDKI